MQLITIKSQIMSIFKRWNDYCKRVPEDLNKKDIGEKLYKLNLDTVTPEEIAAIIGNSSWACPQKCDECNELSDTIISFGDWSNYDANAAYICPDCLKAAFNLMENNL